MSKVSKAFLLTKEYGIRKSMRIILSKLCTGSKSQIRRTRKIIKKSLRNSVEDLLNHDLMISLLMPVYNTDAHMLRETLESVISQTYTNYELCIYDASDSGHEYVGTIIKDYSAKYGKITYLKGTNKGIASNTNECAAMAKGDYFALLDHDDILHPMALFKVACAVYDKKADFIYTDEVTFDKNIYNIISTVFKPDYSPYLLRSNNYICHFTAFSEKLFKENNGFSLMYDGSQDHELFLRLTDKAECVCHIPEILYFWRAHDNSVSRDINAKKYAVDAGIKAVHDFILDKGITAEVFSSDIFPTVYRIKYLTGYHPLVSIIIPNNEHLTDLSRCIRSIIKSQYTHYEIIIVENNSSSKAIKDYYDMLEKMDNVRIIVLNHPFNYSEFNNAAVKEASGEYLLFLNNDIEAVNEEWIEEMLMYAMQDDVGAVGARLFYPDGRLQHCYLITGAGEDGVAIHAGYKNAGNDYGYLDRIGMVRDVGAVSGACMMVSKEKFKNAGGFDENLAVAYNDVDLCIKLREEGFHNIYTPYAVLTHYESSSRGPDWDRNGRSRLVREAEYIKDKWKNRLQDPYYNSNFSTIRAYMIREGHTR